MGATSAFALPYPELTDPADVPADMASLANAVDAALQTVAVPSAIPGELRMWSGGALPSLAEYGHWVWADGGIYQTATYPKASAHIATAWKTHAGKPDPGAGNFRVPDLRGTTPIGMDAMPGGARANRIARAVAATLAGITGEEYHTLTLAELAAHLHGLTDPQHRHSVGALDQGVGDGTPWSAWGGRGDQTTLASTGLTMQSAGGGGAHENLPPTTFVPYICKLDD